MKRIVMVLVILAVVGGAAFAFDPYTFPEPIEPGLFLISPTIGVGYGFLAFALDITAAVDYALPIPMMVGLESGVVLSVGLWGPTIIPIMARASWHPNFEVYGLDTYVRIKLGYGIGFGDSLLGLKWGGGFAGGGSVGSRYFFNEYIGIFGEVGYTYYYASIEEDDWWSGRYRVPYPLGTYFHTGVTFMF